MSTPSEIPTHPRLRAVQPQWVEHQGQRCLYLRDPLGLTDKAAIIPQGLVPLLSLCDGTRDLGRLRVGLELVTGIRLSASQVENFCAELDSALLLENGAYRTAVQEALQHYRRASHRAPRRAGSVYPSDPDALSAAIIGYCDGTPESGDVPTRSGVLAGVVCPHIDYERGGVTYARLWQRAAPDLRDIELVVVFGTDHAGRAGSLTLTRQSYATPFGVLPTDRKIVDGLADVLGAESAYAEEVHHLNEHSIELAVVWLHHFMDRRAVPVVPVLCGSFEGFINGESDPSQDGSINAALDYLREATADRRTLAIAAADLAHVGPAFGDSAPVDMAGRAKLKADDDDFIAAICRGDAAGFFDISQGERDSRRLCGMPPIYLLLRYLQGVQGEAVGYEQCPADADGGSLVSIVGMLLYEEGMDSIVHTGNE